MEGQPEIVGIALGYLEQGWEIAKTWLLSPAAWSQFALLVVAFVLAVLVARRLRETLTRLITPAEGQTGMIANARRSVLPFLALLMPLLAYVFTAIGEQVVRSLFDSGAVIAFGKRANQ
jgi:hypothetical protein